jgi:hypothetical protein
VLAPKWRADALASDTCDKWMKPSRLSSADPANAPRRHRPRSRLEPALRLAELVVRNSGIAATARVCRGMMQYARLSPCPFCNAAPIYRRSSPSECRDELPRLAIYEDGRTHSSRVNATTKKESSCPQFYQRHLSP